MFLELRDADIGVTRFQQFRFDALDLDHRTCQRDHERFGLALAHDGQHDLRIGLAPHAFDGIVQCHAFDRGVVEFDDQVAGFQSGTRGRGVVDRGNHAHKTVFHADFNAEAAELALSADLHFLESFLVEIRRMRIEADRDANNDAADDQAHLFDFAAHFNSCRGCG